MFIYKILFTFSLILLQCIQSAFSYQEHHLQKPHEIRQLHPRSYSPGSPVSTRVASTSTAKSAIAHATDTGSASYSNSNAGNSSYISNAHDAITYLQTKYSTSGLWPPAGWWNSANALILLFDLRAVDNSNFLKAITDGTNGVFNTTLHKAPPDPSKGFLYDAYLDDEGWWTLAAIKGFDVTGDDTWLKAANLTFNDIAANGLNNVPCGGVFWEKLAGTNHSNSVIATALFIDAAAQLAARYSAQADYYINLATTELKWLLQPALFIDNIIKGDALKIPDCWSNHAVLSYQEGVAIGALVSLSKVTGDQTYLAQANTIANALIIQNGPLTDANGILFDHYQNWDGDTAQFKGIFTRNLVLLQQASPNPNIVTFLQRNADSIWAKDRSGDGNNQLGVLWAGPWDTGSDDSAAMAAHISATMALVAAAIVSGN